MGGRRLLRAQAVIATHSSRRSSPIVDGDGQTGRAPIHLVLRRRGLADLGIAQLGNLVPASEAAHTGINGWIATGSWVQASSRK